MADPLKRILLNLKPALFDRIEKYRLRHEIKFTADAIRSLIEDALARDEQAKR